MLMAASVRATAQGLDFGSPAALFRVVEPLGSFAYPYDIAADGKILAIAPSGATGAAAPLTLLVNWDAGLKK
jgi:hypothetical protein